MSADGEKQINMENLETSNKLGEVDTLSQKAELNDKLTTEGTEKMLDIKKQADTAVSNDDKKTNAEDVKDTKSSDGNGDEKLESSNGDEKKALDNVHENDKNGTEGNAVDKNKSTDDGDDNEEDETESKAEVEDDKSKKDDVDAKKDKEGGEEDDDENVVALAEIDKINENINKTRVDGLQSLHAICFGTQGKNNVVKKNLRAFAGFEFDKDSADFKKKLESIKKTDTKSLKFICDILSLDRKGTKDEIALRVLKFLMEPDESMCVEPDEHDEDDAAEDEDEADAADDQDEVASDHDKRKRKQTSSGGRSGARNSTGRPRRATAGKSKMSAYVDFSSSEESERNLAPAKRKRNDDSESGSDYNPSGGNSDSEGGRGRKAAARGSRGRPSRKSRRRGSDSEEEESELSDAESDVPKRKRAAAGKRGRPSATRSRGRAAARKRKDSDSEEEEEELSEDEEEEMSELSEQSEDDEKSKKNKKSPAPAKNNKSNSKAKSAGRPGRPKKARKESTDEEDDKDETDEDEPLNKKSGKAFPTDEQIRNYVKEILDKANLEEITMKTVCKQVYAKFPEFDLTDKKDFIKATVKTLIAA